MEDIYIGTKVVAAELMMEFDFYSKYRSGELAGHNRILELGYKVRYEDGYISWSPKDVFERCYRKVTDAEQRLVLFTGEKWPEGPPGPLRINVIPKRGE